MNTPTPTTVWLDANHTAHADPKCEEFHAPATMPVNYAAAIDARAVFCADCVD